MRWKNAIDGISFVHGGYLLESNNTLGNWLSPCKRDKRQQDRFLWLDSLPLLNEMCDLFSHPVTKKNRYFFQASVSCRTRRQETSALQLYAWEPKVNSRAGNLRR